MIGCNVSYYKDVCINDVKVYRYIGGNNYKALYHISPEWWYPLTADMKPSYSNVQKIYLFLAEYGYDGGTIKYELVKAIAKYETDGIELKHSPLKKLFLKKPCRGTFEPTFWQTLIWLIWILAIVILVVWYAWITGFVDFLMNNECNRLAHDNHISIFNERPCCANLERPLICEKGTFSLKSCPTQRPTPIKTCSSPIKTCFSSIKSYISPSNCQFSSSKTYCRK